MAILVWTASGLSAKREFIPYSPPPLHVVCINIFPRYNTAKILKESQDAYCAKVSAGQLEDLGEFPEDLAWEPLTEVLRGRVKVWWITARVRASLIPPRFKSTVMKPQTWTVSRG